MKQIKVKILDTNLEAPLMSPKLIRKFEEEKHKVVDKANAAKDISDEATAIEMQCNAVIEFVDDIFGKGSARAVFGEETDLLTCLEAFEELMNMYETQVNPIVEKFTHNAMLRIEGKK
ncbi:Uncharacterised protein [[Eubacterium] contortum]|uniref:DUF6673 domain-containing protein n=1 Tax=Faecalicatena contorta TaxID=39482 RepID=A0A174L940_9FIRM|nr:DUF6673 family protein [Faecalicatena contorta]CUP20792.1 Uncharacterised protein [[Eubacterium] contortum] [Faecalicatena contorta]